MTVVSTPLPAGIRRYLADFVARARRLALARAVALGVCAFAGWMLLWCGVDRFAHLPSAFRLVVLALGVAFLVFRSVPTLLAFYRKMDWVTTAAEVERHNPQFAQRLVTVTSRLLGAADYRGSDEILSRLLREVDQEVTSDRPARLLPLRPAVGPFALAAILLLFIIALLQVPDLRFGALVRRFLDPMAAIPPVTTTRLVVSPGDLALVQSQPLTIEVTARNLGDSPVRLYVNEEDRDWTRIVMTPSGSGQYSFTLPAVDRDLRYHVEGGDARTDDYQVRVLRRPAVAQFRIRYDYPAYTHLAPNTVTNTGGRIEAPGGTHVSLTVVATEPLQAALLTIGSDRVLMDRTADPTIRHADLVVRSDAKYSLDLISTRDVAGTGPAGMSIRSIPDLPPQVRLARAGDVLRLNPRDIVPVLYEALDDYGLKSLALRAQINNHDPVELPIRLWRDPRRQQDVFNLDLATLPLGMGDQVKVWAVATDTAGHTAQGAPLQVVISPRSVDLDAYQRISELHSASQLVQTLVSQLDEGVKAQADIQAPHDALSQAYLSATSRADRAISAASQTATLLRQSLLRAVTHSHSPLLCVSLAEWIDLAETEAAAADEAFRQSGAPGALSDVQRDRLKSALDRIRQMQPRLTAVERGEQAAAVLADDENLLATQKRPAPKDEPGRRRLRETIQRMRQDLSAEAGQLGLDANSTDLDNQLRARVQAEQDTLRDARPVDFAAAAREWAREILRDPLQRLGMEGRLSAAAQAEAIRDDADLIRARDLELASRAVAAVTAAARTGARSKTEAFTNSIVNDLEILCSAWASPDTRQANAAGKARRDLMRLAAGPGSTIATATRGSAAGGEDRQKDAENLAMQASAAAANHQYQDAANLDRALIHRIQGGGKHDTAPSGVDLESTPSDRVEHHEQAVEREMSTAKQLDDLGQVQKKLGSQGGAATELADRQQSVADKIAEVEKDHQGSAPVAPDAGNGRDRAAAEILAAQEQLSSMPQALAAVGSAAAGRREAAMRAGMAHNTAGLAPPDQRDAASRAADEADQTAAEAAGRLTGALQPVSAGVAQALSDRLEPFAPESDAARAAIVGQLVPALQALQQAVKGDDAGAVDRAAGDARKAIESCQRELSAAQNLLMQRDPLVAARWFAKAAAESLSSMPPDLSHAKSHQANVTAALSRAWDQSIHRAAAERLSAIPSMASVLDPAIPPGNGAAPQQASKFAAAREWGRLRPPEGPDVNASMHDADPAGYEESLKLYFEALGKAQASK